ncbi:hypothetical protein CHGG_06660 [Chaetomium globosum CBS 148.51]|uniref:CMP/dCMP-type deaminase domain-containing protein n=1 Tax=Chaetomium globosum (strain ATCC 6205 / CBS 148.51 / DSM 1962 / NBRC 6347 / NRRL 1970) TaxID=306901 RepID=Q2H3V5_CHAGB|nr:uncharacterized protein CHGG_06660 [Chaetomium globosum CBS 148.51]EAQ90041.1 hypothetical protein CHGG_06660 [Chaetomium globosum CBS 148.51]
MVSAIRLKTTAFLQSLFLFPFNTALQVVQLFPNFRQTNPPILPCSTPSSSSASSSQEARNTTAGDGSRNSDDNMAAISSATVPRGQHAPASKIISALPRTPPGTKENHLLKTVSPTDVDDQLRRDISRLKLNEADTAAETPPNLLKDVVDGGAGNSVENGVGKRVTQNGALLQQSGPDSISDSVAETTTTIQLDGVAVHIRDNVETPEQAAERAMHSRFMREALDMARLALKTNETPVGCVLVYKGRVIARGMNATNVTRNGTRHAELMAISALLSYLPKSDLESKANASHEKGGGTRLPLGNKTNEAQVMEETSTWGDVDPKDGHLYPYGQKLHPSPRVDPSVITECTLYVTVEPCVMCASLLRQFGIKKVYFGAVNDKFGGTGGVFRIHKNSPYTMASAPPSPVPQNGKGIARPVLERRPASTDIVPEEHTPVNETKNGDSLVPCPIETSRLPGDGGNVERGYEAEGGWGRDEAVTLLRQFYVQENNRAPVPRKKEGRAARLAAMMERDGQAGGPVDAGDGAKSRDNSGTNTPVIEESRTEIVAEAIAV